MRRGDPPRNLIAEQLRGIQPAQQAVLNVRLGAIETERDNEHGSVLPPNGISGPLKKPYRHLYEIKIFGSVKGANRRVILCRGPNDGRVSLTLLYVMEEKDNKPVPRNALEIANERYKRLVDDERRRCPHEWIPPRRNR